MKLSLHSFWLAVLFCHLNGLSLRPSHAAERAFEFRPAQLLPEFDAHFHNRAPWIGGDGAYSVALNPDTTAWLFSDTFVGEVSDNKRVKTKMVNNTVALQHGKGKDARFEFFIRIDATGSPAALFAPEKKTGWFWLQAAASTPEKLCVILAQIEKTSGSGAFAFKHFDQKLGVISNPSDTPDKWKLNQLPLPCTEFSPQRSIVFGSAILSDGDFTYIYGIDEKNPGALSSKKMIVARVKTADIEKFDQWRFFKDGDWQPDFKSSSPLADGLANEYSVSFLPALKKFVLVYTERGISPKILARAAPAPWGPWSPPVTLFECPEVAWDKRVFCYAAKAHPMLAEKDDELIISYVAGSHDFWHVFKDARLYWPRFIRATLTPAKGKD